MTKYLRVKNWSKFQHYKDRRPPWIKLYPSLLQDYDYSLLSDNSKLTLLHIWMLASLLDNKIPNDPKWVGKQIPISCKVDLESLISLGFLEIYEEGGSSVASCKQDASNALASRKHIAIPEREGEESQIKESESEESQSVGHANGATATTKNSFGIINNQKKELNDQEFLAWLKENYDWIDVDREIKKMTGYYMNRKGPGLSRRRVVAWLNRCDKPFKPENSLGGKYDVLCGN